MDFDEELDELVDEVVSVGGVTRADAISVLEAQVAKLKVAAEEASEGGDDGE